MENILCASKHERSYPACVRVWRKVSCASLHIKESILCSSRMKEAIQSIRRYEGEYRVVPIMEESIIRNFKILEESILCIPKFQRAYIVCLQIWRIASCARPCMKQSILCISRWRKASCAFPDMEESILRITTYEPKYLKESILTIPRESMLCITKY